MAARIQCAVRWWRLGVPVNGRGVVEEQFMRAENFTTARGEQWGAWAMPTLWSAAGGRCAGLLR